MSRFAEAMGKTNTAFNAYLFADVTTALYNFWLHDLSDVYLEVIKRRMATPTPATHAIWTVLKAGRCARHSI